MVIMTTNQASVESQLRSLGFHENRNSNWSRGNDIVQIVRSSEINKVRITWREEWKDYFAIIFNYSEVQGPICIVPAQVFFNASWVKKKRSEQSYINSGYYWSQPFTRDHELIRLIFSFSGKWEILGGKASDDNNHNLPQPVIPVPPIVTKRIEYHHTNSPAQLICTIKQFHAFIGPKIRNEVNILTKSEKRRLNNICQNPNCRKQTELDAAHVKGNGRVLIINQVLKKYVIDEKEQKIVVELNHVIDEILQAHQPIGDHIKFLCTECHRKYDNGLLALEQPR